MLFDFEQISNVSDEHIAKLEKKYTTGKKVRARVIGHRVMDALATASLKVTYTLTSCLGSATLVFNLATTLPRTCMMLLTIHKFHAQWMIYEASVSTLRR